MTDPYGLGSRAACPSSAWDAYCQSQEVPDDICCECGTPLPEEDPGLPDDPDANSWWWHGFCSADCLLQNLERIGATWDATKGVWRPHPLPGLDKATLERHRRRTHTPARPCRDNDSLTVGRKD